MTRLTNNVRDQIVRNAIAKTTIGAETEALQHARYALAEEFRIAALGGPEEAAKIEKMVADIEKRLKAVPKGLVIYAFPFRRDDDMWHMNLGGLRVTLPFSADPSHKRLAPSGATFTGEHALVLRFHDLENQWKELDNKRDTLRLKVRAVLNSVTTVKKLLDVWPEAKELLPAQLEEARVQLPAVQTASLNAELGLPSETLDTPPQAE